MFPVQRNTRISSSPLLCSVRRAVSEVLTGCVWTTTLSSSSSGRDQTWRRAAAESVPTLLSHCHNLHRWTLTIFTVSDISTNTQSSVTMAAAAGIAGWAVGTVLCWLHQTLSWQVEPPVRSCRLFWLFGSVQFSSVFRVTATVQFVCFKCWVFNKVWNNWARAGRVGLTRNQN